MEGPDDLSFHDGYSSGSSTPAQDTFSSSPSLYLTGGTRGFRTYAGDDYTASEPYSPHPFRYNNSHAHSASLPSLPSLVPSPGCTLHTQRIQALERHCDSLVQENMVLTVENRTLNSAYTLLVTKVGPAVPGPVYAMSPDVSQPGLRAITEAPEQVLAIPVVMVPAKRSDFPKVLYWFMHEWTAHKDEAKGESSTASAGPRGSKRASQGINVTMLYVTDVDGVAIDGYRCTAIRNFALKLFLEMAANGLAPTSWQKGTLSTARAFSAAICQSYPEMGYCADDWKVQHMATNMYSSWYNGRKCKNASVTIKSEAPEASSTSAEPPFLVETAKRPIDDSDISSKRQKLDVSQNPVVVPTVAEAQPFVIDTESLVPIPFVIQNPLFIKTVAITSDSVPTPPSSDTATTPLPIHTEDDAIQAPVMVATAAAAGLTAPAAVAAPKNDKKATPGKSSTPRNLCMIKWCIDNPGGMNSKFKLHWDTIHKTPAAEEWIAASAAAAAAKTKAAS
ncbi:hypothetical protein C8J57DRAFT_1712596 [Mycena rebaudengoi]|nr:hypothetical protein C8J57DRAFT_1464943 [Mycena rebaudengoi]KAJ7279617.1 hypothetical protein C8J57DRAFT_1712596 [Mycena rebaudengoi]